MVIDNMKRPTEVDKATQKNRERDKRLVPPAVTNDIHNEFYRYLYIYNYQRIINKKLPLLWLCIPLALLLDSISIICLSKKTQSQILTSNTKFASNYF